MICILFESTLKDQHIKEFNCNILWLSYINMRENMLRLSPLDDFNTRVETNLERPK